MKFLFFDIDGVLNKSSDWKIRSYSMDDALIETFCRFVRKNKLTPVITSSWRSGFVKTLSEENSPQIRELESKFQKYGVEIPDHESLFLKRMFRRRLKRLTNPGSWLKSSAGWSPDARKFLYSDRRGGRLTGGGSWAVFSGFPVSGTDTISPTR